MTLSEVFNKAWHELLREWAYEDDFLKMNPDDEIAKIREANAWQKINDLKAMADEMGIKF